VTDTTSGRNSSILLSEAVEPDHPAFDMAREIVTRWWRNKPEDDLPPRSVFPAEGWGAVFGRVSILEPLDGGRDFRYRLHSGTAAAVGGRDLTGTLVSEMPYEDYAEELIRQFSQALESGEPGFHRLKIEWNDTVFDYSRVALPVRTDDGEVQVLSVILHTDPLKDPYRSRFMSARS